MILVSSPENWCPIAHGRISVCPCLLTSVYSSARRALGSYREPQKRPKTELRGPMKRLGGIEDGLGGFKRRLKRRLGRPESRTGGPGRTPEKPRCQLEESQVLKTLPSYNGAQTDIMPFGAAALPHITISVPFSYYRPPFCADPLSSITKRLIFCTSRLEGSLLLKSHVLSALIFLPLSFCQLPRKVISRISRSGVLSVEDVRNQPFLP